MKNYIFFLFYLLLNPGLITLLLKRIYLPTYPQYAWLEKYNINTVIDIGAYHGDVSKVMSYLFPNAAIYAFEPNPEQYQKMKRSCRRFNNFTPVNSALSNKIGTVYFYVSPYAPASSLLSPSTLYKQKDKRVTRLTKITIKTTTLDTFFSDKKLKKPIFIKMDTQGSEKLIIEGGKKILEQASIVHIETSFTKLYKNQCLFKDIYEILTGLGYIYKGSINESHFYPDYHLSDQENSIFIKDNIS